MRIDLYTKAVLTVFAVCLGLGWLGGVHLMSQQQPCPDPARRMQAIRLARQINSAQIRSLTDKTGIQPLSAFPDIVVSPGFIVKFVHTASEYALSVKDTQAGCGFTVFSDQEGVIYTGQPLQ